MQKRHDFDQVPGCTMWAALNLISGKWKGMILYRLLRGAMRFNALKRELGDCSQRLLVKQLRELEDDGLVERTVYAAVPPRVEYALTDEGRALEPILISLRNFGHDWLRRRGLTARDDHIMTGYEVNEGAVANTEKKQDQHAARNGKRPRPASDDLSE